MSEGGIALLLVVVFLAFELISKWIDRRKP